MEIDITQFGKGCQPTPPEIKKDHYVLRAGIPKVIDWSKPYKIENGFILPQRNQMSKFDCTGQATVYYGQALNKIHNNSIEVYSADHIYKQTRLPNGGAFIYQSMSIPVKQGFASIESVPEPNTEDEVLTLDISNAKIEAIALKYAQIPSKDINYLAQIVEDYGGFVTGFQGNNTIVQNAILNIPTVVDWGHAVYVCGYCTLSDGRKALIFKNSWSSSWGDNGYGYFTEEFIKSPYFFDAYTYASIEDIENMIYIKSPDSKDKRRWVVEGGVKFWILDPDTVSRLSKAEIDFKEDDITKYPYGGCLFVGNPDEPKT